MAKRLTGYRFFAGLLKAIKRQIREVQGPEDAELKRYYRGYARTLEKSRFHPSDPGEFLAAGAEKGIALVGDFHTLDQAQRQFIKVAKAMHEAGRPPVLALEMVLARHDGALQEFLHSGAPDEATFLDETGYFDNWGFDFNHYRPILALARKLDLPVHGINSEGPLAKRDKAMASRLAKLRADYPGRPLLVLVGDLHLAPGHLPRELSKHGLEPAVLFQNSESVTMDRMRRGEEPFGWFRINGSHFLVNNTAPWVKMQTYLTWLEHGGEALCTLLGACARQGGDDEDEEAPGAPDLTETVHGYIRILKDLFDLHLKADDTFQVFTMKDLDFLDDPYFRRRPGSIYAKIIREGHALYMTRGNIIYIPILDVNRTVQEAAHYLMGEDADVGPGVDSFFRRLHYCASGYLASKMINPLRHYRTRDSMHQAKEEWSRARSPKERRYAEHQLAVFNNTLNFFDRVEEHGGCSRMPLMELDRFVKLDHDQRFGLSIQIGAQLGEGLYAAYDAGELSGAELKHYIFSQSDPFHYCRTFRRHLAEGLEGPPPA